MDTAEEGEQANLTVSRHELVLLNNTLNEICNGPDAIEDWEFDTRVGSTRAEGQALLDRLGKAIENLDAKGNA